MGVSCRTSLILAATVLALGGALGCDVNKLPTPPETKTPPAETTEAITAELEKGLRPLYDWVPTLTRQSPVPPAFGTSLKSYLQESVKKYSGSKVGKEALRNVVRHLEDVLKQARDAQNGLAVLLICDLIKIIEPNNSRLPRYIEWATIEKNRPVVMYRGWYEDREAKPPVTYYFLEVFLPETGKVENLRVREGEDFLGLKLIKVIGSGRGLRFEYLKTGDLFEVYLR